MERDVEKYRNVNRAEEIEKGTESVCGERLVCVR